MDGMQKVLKISIKKMFHNNNASIGIGAMIVFIAIVLVAGIAASVLIQTSNQLENQAMQTGQNTEDEVSAGIRIYQIIGNHNNRNVSGTYYNRYHNMSIMITARGGSDTMDLSETIITMSDGTRKVVLSWNSGAFASSANSNGLFSTGGIFDLNASEFGICVLEDQDNSCTSTAPGITIGDKILLCVNLSSSFNCGLTGRTDVRGLVIAEEAASPGVFLFTVPAVNSHSVVEFF